jgi:hypothetical protein
MTGGHFLIGKIDDGFMDSFLPSLYSVFSWKLLFLQIVHNKMSKSFLLEEEHKSFSFSKSYPFKPFVFKTSDT